MEGKAIQQKGKPRDPTEVRQGKGISLGCVWSKPDWSKGVKGKVIDCVSKINTGGKYDSKAFKKSIGLNGVGTKAVNALSDYFRVQSVRDGQTKIVEFQPIKEVSQISCLKPTSINPFWLTKKGRLINFPSAASASKASESVNDLTTDEPIDR